MWTSKGRSGYGDTNLDGTYDDVILGVSPNGRQYRNEATLEQRDLSGWAYWNLRKQITPEQEIPEALYARNETESMSHTLANGRANLAKYADPVVVKKPTKVPLKQRILPQSARVEKLHSEAMELEVAFKAGEFSLNDYSLLRDVAFAKLQRAEVLYKKAIAAKPIKTGDEYEEVSENYAYETCDVDYANTPLVPSCGVSWIDDLSPSNSFKSFLKMSCKVVKISIEWHNRTKAYIQTLKEV